MYKIDKKRQKGKREESPSLSFSIKNPRNSPSETTESDSIGSQAISSKSKKKSRSLFSAVIGRRNVNSKSEHSLNPNPFKTLTSTKKLTMQGYLKRLM